MVRETDGIERTRREFCAHACQAVSLAALGAFVQGCGGGGGGGGNPAAPSNVPQLPTIGSSIVNNTITLTIDAASPLANVGSAALVQASGRGFLVSRDDADTFIALTAICTHEACTVTGFQNQRYVCPCHGSRYNLSGGVETGPAPLPLARFTTESAGNTLTIHV
jgi:Rieske Fe-S protein